jgi:hypothetical protein
MRILITLLICLSMTGTLLAEPWFVGGWKVDVEATLEAFRADPSWDDKDKTGEKMFRGMAPKMGLEFTQTEFVFRRPGKEERTAYKVVRIGEQSATLKFTVGNETRDMDLTLRDERLNFKVGGGDMDRYLWVKSP